MRNVVTTNNINHRKLYLLIKLKEEIDMKMNTKVLTLGVLLSLALIG